MAMDNDKKVPDSDQLLQNIESSFTEMFGGKKAADIDIAALMSQWTKVVMSMIQPLYGMLHNVTKQMEKLNEKVAERDSEMSELISSIRELSESFEARIQALPDMIQQQPEVAAAVREHREQMKEILKKAYTDNLTGLYNRNHLSAVLAQEKGRWVGFMIDIDHFKKINDEFGHDRGDEVLRNVAGTIKENVTMGRRRVLPFRLGGEEIGILVKVRSAERADPDEEISYVRLLAEQLRREIKNGCGCTVSIGVANQSIDLPLPASWEKSEKKFSEIFGDENMYKAKESGRDRVVIDQKKLREALATPAAPARKGVGPNVSPS